MSRTPRIQIDQRVKRIVKSLNTFPGIYTFSSCGGHAKQTCTSQVPKNEFNVNFSVDPARGGWRSLELIVYALGESPECQNLKVEAWPNGTPGCLSFELRGIQNADPDELANLFDSLRGRYDDPDEEFE